MNISSQILKELQEDAGTERTIKAKRYNIQKKVNFTKVFYINQDNFEIKAVVEGTEEYNTYILIADGEIQDISCTCPDYQKHYGVCKHSLATVLALKDMNKPKDMHNLEEFEINNISKHDLLNLPDEFFEQTPKKIQYQNNNYNKKEARYKNFRQMVNNFYNEELDSISGEQVEVVKLKKENIILEPKIYYDKFSNDMRIEFKIGNKRLYKLKDLPGFYNRMLNKEFYRYGEKLQFVHTKEAFTEEMQPLLEFVLKYAEIIKFANSNSNSNYRYYGKTLSETSIMLSNTGIDDLFEIMKNQTVKFQKDGIEGIVKFIDNNPDLEFVLNKINQDEYSITPNTDIFSMNIIQGKNYKYILQNDEFYRMTPEFIETNVKLLQNFKTNYITELYLQKQDLVKLFSIVIPKTKNAIKMGNIEENEIQEYKPKELGVKVFLDFDENDYIIADIKFCYDTFEFNPLDENQEIDIPRNIVEEAKMLNIFHTTGFMFDTQNIRFILPDDDKIYEFLTNDITYYMQKFEVMVTENFKTKQVKKPKINALGVKVENDLLKIDFSKIDFDIQELQDIMSKYKMKKRYHRLKDGTFLDLENNKEIAFFEKLITGMDISYKDLEQGEVKLPVNRSLYMNQLLRGIKGTEIIKNKEYKTIVNNLNQEFLEEHELPQNLNAQLRYYQKTGYSWLQILDNYHFGGILADDMGLGKTIQVLSIILAYVEKQQNIKNKSINIKPSIVISPSSLTLNWLNEAHKFTPSLKTTIIRGTAQERKEQIERIPNSHLIITSYDLLKRDIEIYKQYEYDFRFAIADEAQYLKNSNTQNAKAVKQIKAQSRFALTGTPIENSLAELWSIFDFIMPGYLFGYKNFKTTYEIPIVKENDEKAMEKLKMLIEPFVLRRTKKEVLTELPEKTMTILNNEMEEEQQNIYLTYLAQVREEVAKEINMNGFEKSQIKILALLTRLRQICCHPKLFLENYQGNSSKLNQCIEIVEDAISSQHKILIFSTYTSMFEIMEQEFQKKHIKYFKLTGNTPVDERIKLVDKFNEDSEIKVFLISLKAGGTGLNLTGADIVIHYDPWWNLSAENQATDRAYRIGQKNNVQVYKLITKNSIEEKIYNLQMKKEQLVENMLNTKTTFINKLSKDDIMKLFS